MISTSCDKGANAETGVNCPTIFPSKKQKWTVEKQELKKHEVHGRHGKLNISVTLLSIKRNLNQCSPLPSTLILLNQTDAKLQHKMDHNRPWQYANNFWLKASSLS